VDYSNKSKEELIKEIELLKQKEDIISIVLNNINEIIFHLSFDEKGNKKFEYLSVQTEKIIGLTPEEYIKINIEGTTLDHVHPDDKERLVDESKKVKVNNKKYIFTYRFFNKILDKYIWVEETLIPNFNEKNKLIALFGTAIDVTKKIEGEEQLSFLINNIEESIYNVKFTENDKKLTFVSPHIFKLTGLTVKEFHEEGNKGTLLDRVHPDDKDVIMKTHKDLYDNNKKQVKSIFRLKPKGKDNYLWIEEDLYAIYDKKGELIETTTVLRDITYQKEFDEKLKFSKDRFNLLSDATNEVVLIHDKGIILDVNKSVKKKFGYEPEELIGKSVLKLTTNKTTDKVKNNGNSSDNITYEAEGLRKDGYTFYGEVTSKAITFKGKTIKVVTIRDISEKKAAISYLKENEEKYRTIFTKNLAGVFITKDDIIIDCNNSFAKIFGFKSRVELIGKPVLNLYFNEADRKIYIKELKEKGILTNYRIRHKNKNGDEIWILTNVHIKKDGKIEGTLIDITKQIKVEQKLIESEKGYKQLINKSPYGTLIHVDGKIIFANEKAFDLLGINCFDDLKGNLNMFDYLLNEYKEESLNRRKLVLEGKEVPYTEIKVKKPLTGEIITFETKAMLTDFQGVQAIQVVFQDISDRIKLTKQNLKLKIIEESNKLLQNEIKEREKAEQKLKDNEKYLSSIINSSLDIICTSDCKGNIIEFNKAAELAFGYKQKDIMHTSISKIYAYKKDYVLVSKSLKEKNNFIGEICNIRKDGSIFTSFLSASVLFNDKGEEIGTMGVSRDITELKEAENQLIDSLKEKEILLKEVHHRVKNNLQVISSILNLQSSYVKDENTLNILKESQNRIKSMSFIHESLYQTNDFSSINFSEYIVSLSKNLVHSYGLYDDLIELNFIIDEVQLNLDDSIPCGLIVNELVSNALKYAFKEFEEGIITIQLFVKNENVHLIVKDNGIGLPKDIDFRDTETLGLQLVTSLIEQLEGTIELNTNKGTEYTIIFKHN